MLKNAFTPSQVSTPAGPSHFGEAMREAAQGRTGEGEAGARLVGKHDDAAGMDGGAAEHGRSRIKQIWANAKVLLRRLISDAPPSIIPISVDSYFPKVIVVPACAQSLRT